jgi:hypothetical protein
MELSFFYELGPPGLAHFFVIEGAMSAAVTAAIASFQEVFRRKHRISLLVIIEILPFDQLFHW